MLLIKNGHIKTMAGPDLENGCVLIGDDGKILAVGEIIDVPEGAEVIDARGALVTPGCVDAHCHIGLDNEAVGWEGKDYNEMADPLTPQLRAIDSIDSMDEAFDLAIRAGLDIEEGWRAITINPARQIGVADRVGSLEPGKDGDVVIWNGNPLTDVGAEAAVTILEGKIVYRAE